MMEILRKGILLLIIGCFGSGLAFGIENAPLSNYTNARKLAMGNVQGPTAEGVEALYMNPAGIVRKDEVSILSLGLGPNVNLDPSVVIGMGQWLTNMSIDLDGVLPYADFSNGVGGTLSLSAGASYAGFAAGMNFNADLQVRRFNTESPVTLIYLSETSIGGGGSYAMALGESTLFVGAAVRQVYQASTHEDLDVSDIPTLLDDPNFTAQIPAVLGSGLAIDAGAIMKSGPLMVSFNVKNIGGTRLHCQSGTLADAMSVVDGLLEGAFLSDPSLDVLIPQMSGVYVEDQIVPMTFVVGAGLDIDLYGLLRMQVAADYSWKFMSETLSDTTWKNVHIGGELNLLDTLYVRGGINQGYLTGGVGVSMLKFFNLLDFHADITYYAWEMGSYAGHRQSEAMKVDLVFSL